MQAEEERRRNGGGVAEQALPPLFLNSPNRLVRPSCLVTAQFLQSFFHFPIPEAVNERVESGGDNGIEDGDNFVHIEGMDCSGPGIHENRGGVEDGNHHQVGSTRGESFLLSCGHA